MRAPSTLHRPALTRLLQDLVPVDGERPSADLAARLGDWLSAMDSIQLDGALQAIHQFGSQARGSGQPLDVAALTAHCRQVQADLQSLVAHKLKDSLAEPAPDFAAHHKRHQDLQRQFELKTTQCRTALRQALSKGTPRLRQMVALDAALGQLLQEREQRLLASVPVLLERRFQQRKQAHELRQSELDTPDEPEQWTQPGGWLHTFSQDHRDVLLAELQQRWQPILGLIDAAQAAYP